MLGFDQGPLSFGDVTMYVGWCFETSVEQSLSVPVPLLQLQGGYCLVVAGSMYCAKYITQEPFGVCAIEGS